MPRQKGMTLLEVLVALAIMSAVVGSLLVLMGQHARQAARLEERMLARIVAENALAGYIAARRTNREADLAGEVELSDRRFRFEIDRGPASVGGFESVTAEVRMDRDRQVIATLTTLRRNTSP